MRYAADPPTIDEIVARRFHRKARRRCRAER
jgi:hypothetical protein